MKTFVIIFMMLGLVACATPADLGGGSGPSGKAEGGKASATPVGTDTNLALAQPGADALALAFRNSDQTANSVAGDAPLLVFGGGGAEARAMLKDPDPVADAITEQYKFAAEKMGTSTTPEDRDLWMARTDTLIASMALHVKEKLEAAKGISGDFSALTTVVFTVVSLRLAGLPPEKLSPETVEALTKNIGKVIKPALEGSN